MFLPLLALTQAAELPPEAIATWAALDANSSLSADFTQVRHSQLLSRPITSSGTLAFERPDRMAWTVTAPARSTFILDGAKVGMAYPDLGMREEIDLASNAEVASLVQGMMVWLGGDLETVSKDYDVAWASGTPSVATLTPKDDKLSAIIGTLDLSIAESTIQKVVITEPDGDRVEITFDNVTPNATLGSEAFALP
ncbi:MAG: outer membrane lipoprotein carrier protein LolA [Proteobacteria bacterium]|nr:outer membrane lipoprotein carrier protein LolA [Pseudomonadota bacterium]MCP4915606.1 outer membrane lipoprotein carrier protein LolA [Pseudomonadota bacterium]